MFSEARSPEENRTSVFDFQWSIYISQYRILHLKISKRQDQMNLKKKESVYDEANEADEYNNKNGQ